MATNGSAQPSFKNAIGAVKDSTKVGLVKVNGDHKKLDIAIVKATKHNEKFPKEKHVRTIFNAVSCSSPRPVVQFCLHAMAKRLSKTHNWTVALKILIVIHRAIREVDPSLLDELINFNRHRSLSMLNLAHLRDDSSTNAWDYSAWVRTYALYLEERLACFSALKYDVDIEQLRNKHLDPGDLVEQLPVLQQLFYRLLACKPVGAAMYNNLIHYALSMIAGESVNLYVAITDRIVRLVDKFFEMDRQSAIRALEIYRKAGNQADQLYEFFEICRALEFGQKQKYVKIEQPPASFLASMEEYVNEAPQALVLGSKSMSCSLIEHKHEDADVQENLNPSVPSPDSPQSDQNQAVATPQVADLLCFDDITQEASRVDEKDPLPLGTATSNEAAIADSTLTGGLDLLKLDSLYDEATAGRTNQNQASHNPFEDDDYNQDPFSSNNSVAPPASMQMEATAQHEAFFTQQQEQPSVLDPNSTILSGNPIVEQTIPSHPPQNSSLI